VLWKTVPDPNGSDWKSSVTVDRRLRIEYEEQTAREMWRHL